MTWDGMIHFVLNCLNQASDGVYGILLLEVVMVDIWSWFLVSVCKFRLLGYDA